MNKVYYIWILIVALMLCGIDTTAQSVDRQVISSIGLELSSGNWQVSQTVGEAVIDSLGSSLLSVSQGYQQEVQDSQSVSLKDWDSKNWVAYPNPTRGRLNLVLPNDNLGSLTVEVVNGLGSTCMFNVFELATGTINLDLTDFAAGIYYVKVIKDSVSIQTFRISKI